MLVSPAEDLQRPQRKSRRPAGVIGEESVLHVTSSIPLQSQFQARVDGSTSGRENTAKNTRRGGGVSAMSTEVFCRCLVQRSPLGRHEMKWQCCLVLQLCDQLLEECSDAFLASHSDDPSCAKCVKIGNNLGHHTNLLCCSSTQMALRAAQNLG